MARTIIDTIPDDILLAVLSVATADAGKSLGRWASALPVLGVSRRWRRLGVGIVYRTVFVGDGVDKGLTYVGAPHSDAELCVENRRSNAGLFRMVGRQQQANELVVMQVPSRSPLQPLESAQAALGTDRWGGVTTLHVTMCCTPFNALLFADDDRGGELEAEAAAHMLVQTVPNVSRLFASSMLRGEVLERFYQVLGGRYFAQLEQVAWKVSATLGFSCAARGLRHCSMHTVNNEQNLPLMSPALLEDLELLPFKNYFSWLCFHTNRDLDWISFDRLTSLYLNGSHSGVDVPSTDPLQLGGGRKVKILFPCLTHLKIHSVNIDADTMRMFAASPLRVFDFDGPVEGASLLRPLRLDRVKTIRVKTWFGFTVPDSGFYQDTNELFGGGPCGRRVSFWINLECKVLDPVRISWPALTHLTLTNDFIPDFGLYLVPCVPNLVFLELRIFADWEDAADGDMQQDIAAIAEQYTTPSASKIARVRLTAARRAPQRINDLLVDMFSRYLPCLVDFEV
ncbi:hypothetical protein GGF46_001507 [Coemansia sp. RSA 552]|nr:hypothetical protein GGF46_001507 [Coemansia sp. RSA 552]